MEITTLAIPEKGRGMSVKYHDIPDDLREAGRVYAILMGRGESIPEDIRVKNNEYKRWLRYGGKDPATIPKKPPANEYIPEDLRNAYSEYNRLQHRGIAPPKDIAAKANEYIRWRMHKGKPPAKKRHPLPKPDEVDWPYSAYLEWNAMIKDGVPPGEIPTRLAEGYAEYLGKPVNKYAPCGPPGKKTGHGCRGRHGDGPTKLPFVPGVAACKNCRRTYTDVPDDVTRCGCCGKLLHRQPRKHRKKSA